MNNVTLANKIWQLSLTTKHNHWALRGNDAPYLHKQLDELFEDLVDFYDKLFEDAYANGDEVWFEVALSAGPDTVDVPYVVASMGESLRELIDLCESIDSRRGTDNIIDDIAEGLTNWVYLLSLYTESKAGN